MLLNEPLSIDAFLDCESVNRCAINDLRSASYPIKSAHLY